jgi:hypothetical protein
MIPLESRPDEMEIRKNLFAQTTERAASLANRQYHLHRNSGLMNPEREKVQELDVAALDDFEARFFVEPPERFGIQITICVTDRLVQPPTKLDDSAGRVQHPGDDHPPRLQIFCEHLQSRRGIAEVFDNTE